MGGYVEQLFSSFPLHVVILAFFLVIISTAAKICYRTQIQYPPNLPRVREPEGSTRFSLKTRLAYYTDCEALYKEAYETYSKHGKTCLLPSLGFRNDVIIPSSSLRWYITQPDRVLSSYEAFIEINQADYTTGGSKVIRNPWQAGLVKREMLGMLEPIITDLDDELRVAIDQRFGVDEEGWKEIDLFETVRLVIAQGSSRFTVGLPLCRDELYLEKSLKCIDITIAGAIIIGILPRFFRPIIGYFYRIFTLFALNSLRASLASLYHSRLPFLSSPSGPHEPCDHLQMMLRHAATCFPSELNLTDITHRLAVSNTGSFHQASIAITNALFSILDSDSSDSTISTLRQEAAVCSPPSNAPWTHATTASMTKIDSVCRETLRLYAFGNRAIFKKVQVGGLVTPDGISLPKGAMLSVLAQPAQCDPEFFEKPLAFDPFRFSRAREADAISFDADESRCVTPQESCGDKTQCTVTPPLHPPKKLAFVATGPVNLAFAHGKHACPGRFIVDFEMKIVLAYLLLRYDMEVVEKGVSRRAWAAEACVLAKDGKVRVRRRKEGGMIG